MKKNGFTLIELMIAVALIFIFIVVIGGCSLLVWAGCNTAKAIDEKGIEGVSERIWEGRQEQVEQ